MFTKRNIAKFVKDQIVWTAATAATSTAIHTVVEEPTENQEIGIEIGSLAVGYMAMLKLQSVTDRPIDAVANWRENRKVAKTAAEVVA
jgi:hypothetical protein